MISIAAHPFMSLLCKGPQCRGYQQLSAIGIKEFTEPCHKLSFPCDITVYSIVLDADYENAGGYISAERFDEVIEDVSSAAL
jgi:hypothetical protein